jgi:DNA primase
MDATDLKQYIIDNNKIKNILDDLGCHDFKEYSKEYRCGLPEHESKNNIAIKKETLSTKIFTPDSQTIRGDIYTLVMFTKEMSFVQANKFIHNLFGLDFKIKSKAQKEEKKDPLQVFKKVKKKRFLINKDDIEIYDDDLIKEYIPLPHISWIKEGILPFTCEKFKIGYSANKKRIIIPTRYWCGDENEYIGVMGRTTIKEYEMLDIPKYFPLKPYLKSMNIYGLQENYQTIQEAGHVVVAESQKSVLKRHSRKDGTVVALESHDISDEQVKILIGLDVEVIIAMDVGIDINHVRSMCERFYGIRQVSYIYDKYELLKEKEAPMDAPDKMYKYLLKYRIPYDGKEHNEYLKYLEVKERKNK